jgi:hypothetical protein
VAEFSPGNDKILGGYMEFTVEERITVKDLIKAVNELIAQGWQPIGGIGNMGSK